MARSDRPQSTPGGWPQRAGGPTQAPARDPWGHAQQGQGAYDPQGYASGPLAQDPYGRPLDGDAYGGVGSYGTPGQQGYANAPDPNAGQGYGQGQLYGQPGYPQDQAYPAGYQSQGHYQPPAAPAFEPAAQPQAGLRGAQYDQWPAAQSPADPRNYDLSSYMPPQTRQQPEPQPSAGGYSDWGHQGGGGYAGYAGQPDYYPEMAPVQTGASLERGYDPAGGYRDSSFGAAPQGHAPQGYDAHPYGDAGAEDYDEEYEAEPPRRSRTLTMVGGALVAAVVVGGGLTLAYRSLLGTEPGGPTPVVRSAEGPLKVKPESPGGREIPYKDSKLLGRLGDTGAAADTDASGSRKVATLVVGRDGRISVPPAAPVAAPTEAAPPAPAAAATEVPSPSVQVPGLTVVDVTGPTVTTPPPAPSAPTKPVVVASAEPSANSVTTQSVKSATGSTPAAPRTLNSGASSSARADETEAPAKPAPVVKTAAVEKKERTPAPTGPAPTGAGYVAVLASVPASGSSRLEALKQFADLQQQYSSVLQSKTPDIQEANLGEKGRYHRLLVGPPGSRDAANQVCAQLKAQGYTSCWIMAY